MFSFLLQRVKQLEQQLRGETASSDGDVDQAHTKEHSSSVLSNTSFVSVTFLFALFLLVMIFFFFFFSFSDSLRIESICLRIESISVYLILEIYHLVILETYEVQCF